MDRNVNDIEKDLAAIFEDFSSGITQNIYLEFFDLIAGLGKYSKLKSNDIVDSSSGDVIELDNGVKFRWER